MGPHLPHQIHSFSHLPGLGHSPPSRPGSPSLYHGVILPAKPIEEETIPHYNADKFYPVKLGEVLCKRYEVVSKLGYGTSATVWLARDLHLRQLKHNNRYVTIKINVNRFANQAAEEAEMKVTKHLADVDPKHPGYKHVRLLLDSFKLAGPNGSHLCLVYEPLREPLNQCMQQYRGHLFNSELLKELVPGLLRGLDYMHSECHIIHTDLKPDNLMMGIGNPAVLEHHVQEEIAHPSPRKSPDSKGRVIYKSRSEFGNASAEATIRSVKITDFGLAVWGSTPGNTRHHNTPIQSNAFTAPEVILAAGWSYPADIWNFGVMLWDLLENFGLFDGIDTDPGAYKSKEHLAYMIALLGPPPKTLLERGSTTSTYFDEDGKFRHPKLIPADFSFERSVTRLQGEDKELFIDFAKKMIAWLPEDRWTAKQLLDHPWYQTRQQSSTTTPPSSSTSTPPSFSPPSTSPPPSIHPAASEPSMADLRKKYGF